MRGRDDACRVAEHAGSVLQRGGRGPPASREACLEERAGVGPIYEDGDRRHGAESGRVEREVRLAARLQEDVVRVLVLRDDLGNGAHGILSPRP